MKGLQVLNPYSGDVVDAFDYDGGPTLDAKIAEAKAASHEWRDVAVADRVAAVARALDFFRDNRENIARDITVQMGKPIRQSRSEVDAMLERAEYMCSIAEASLAPDRLPSAGFERRIEHAPLGVVLNLAAWNYPLLIAVNVVVPAVLAGNSVLLKHSGKTPLCGRHFAQAFASTAPQHLVTDLVLTHDTTATVIRDPRIDHVAFTGSVGGGRQVLASACNRFIDVGLELGGKDPAYVAEDADLERAVAGVVDGACYNAGQSCCAVERVYVHAVHYDEFLERAKAALAEYELGDPLDETTTMGPLASPSALTYLLDQVHDAVDRGAELVAGGEVADRRFFRPTLLGNCPNDSAVMQEESFGPLVPVARVADDDDALARMNDSSFGLTASIWTESRDRAERFGRALDAGTIYQNRCDFLDPALPWTGCRDSGKGSTLSRYGFLHLTRRRSIHFKD